MRWPVILTLVVALGAVGLEQANVLAQNYAPVARACGGTGYYGSSYPRLLPRLFCRGCGMRGRCHCRAIARPMPCAPACITPVPQMVQRRVVDWEMVPQTRMRRVAHCEQVPVTTYRQVVSYVPQTEYRNIVRHQTVCEQVMVPRRRISTVCEPLCPTPMMAPTMPSPCPTCGPGMVSPYGMGSTIMPQGTMMAPGYAAPPTILPGTTYPNPTLTVPSTPQMHQQVPTPADVDRQSQFVPWGPLSPEPDPYFQADASLMDGYRTIGTPSSTAARPYGFETEPVNTWSR